MLTITVLQLQFSDSSTFVSRMLTRHLDLVRIRGDVLRGAYLPVAEISIDTDDVAEAMECAFVATNHENASCLARWLVADHRSTNPGDLMVIHETGEVHAVMGLGTAKVCSHIAELISVDFMDNGADLLHATMTRPRMIIAGVKTLRMTFKMDLGSAKRMIENGMSVAIARKDLAVYALTAIEEVASRLKAEQEGVYLPSGWEVTDIISGLKVAPVAILSIPSPLAA